MKPRFQFGIVRLFVFMTLTGILFAWLNYIRWNRMAMLYVGIYLMLLILWAVIRGPWIWSQLQQIRQARKTCRIDAMLDLEQRRKRFQENGDGEREAGLPAQNGDPVAGDPRSQNG